MIFFSQKKKLLKEKLKTKALEILQNIETELDFYDYDDITTLKDDIDLISEELKIHCPDLYYELNEKISEYEAYVENRIDFEIEERHLNSLDENEEIDLLFSSLKQ